jgi:hypothetical protein
MDIVCQRVAFSNNVRPEKSCPQDGAAPKSVTQTVNAAFQSFNAFLIFTAE